jgi:hypothetical protein
MKKLSIIERPKNIVKRYTNMFTRIIDASFPYFYLKLNA